MIKNDLKNQASESKHNKDHNQETREILVRKLIRQKLVIKPAKTDCRTQKQSKAEKLHYKEAANSPPIKPSLEQQLPLHELQRTGTNNQERREDPIQTT